MGRLWGTLTDVSLHGCYLEMTNTFPVGTRVQLVLNSCGRCIQTPGSVRASYPALGMGIRFGEMEAASLQQLKQLLTLLSGQATLGKRGPAPEGPEGDTRVADTKIAASALPPRDPKAVLDEITEFFREHETLSRAEFQLIVKQLGQR